MTKVKETKGRIHWENIDAPDDYEYMGRVRCYIFKPWEHLIFENEEDAFNDFIEKTKFGDENYWAYEFIESRAAGSEYIQYGNIIIQVEKIRQKYWKE